MSTTDFLRAAVGFALVLMLTTLYLVARPAPAPDASEPVARETPDGLLVTEAMDTAYVEPHPTPEPMWRDSFALCRARLSQYGDHNWRELVTR